MSATTRRAPGLAGLLVAALVLAAGPAGAADAWKPFIGSYAGEAVLEIDGVSTKRDLEVEISALRSGFRVKWLAVTREDDGRITRKQYTIDFHPSKRDGVFESAMRTDLFGNRAPLDPMAGKPYVWARIADETLSVFSMRITDTGSYEMQVYHRTLTGVGLDVSYTRFAEGEALRTVEGALHRR